AARHQLIDHAFARVAERRVPEVVPERDGLGELLVEAQHLGDRAGDLRHLERMRETGPIVIARRREEHLRLVFQPAERLAVDDAIAVPLKRRTDVVFSFWTQTPARVRAPGGLRREDVAFPLLELLADRHRPAPA